LNKSNLQEKIVNISSQKELEIVLKMMR